MGCTGYDDARATEKSDSSSAKKEYQAEHQVICGTRKQRRV